MRIISSAKVAATHGQGPINDGVAVKTGHDEHGVFHNEHGGMLLAAQSLVNDLRSCNARLQPMGNVQHYHHNQLAERALGLSLHLDAAIKLAEAELYTSPFAVLRTALEYKVFDRLLFLADRFEQEVSGVDESTWKQWQAQKPKDVLKWERSGKDKVRIIWSGPQVRKAGSNDAEYTLSIYYQYLQQYNPFVVSGSESDVVAIGHPMPRIESDRLAKLQRHLWREALSWKNLKENLQLNDLATERELFQLETHYRFLSGFTHPMSDRAWGLIYGHNKTYEVPRYDHYASELSLLYVCYLATSELRDFHAMCLRPPVVGLRDREAIEERIKRTERLIAYFWPPGGEPYEYDLIQEANQRYFDAVAERRPPHVTDPATLNNDEIRYYDNPMSRLIDLHRGFHEVTTGLQFVSPWPRNDALNR